MIVMKGLMVLLLMVVVPVILGSAFDNDEDTIVSSLLYQYILGFFLMLALYQLIAVPMALSYMAFHTVVWLYTITLIICCALILYRKRKKEKKKRPWIENQKIGIFGWIYVVLFVCVLGYQLYHTIFFQFGNNTADDATYVVLANDALQNDVMYTINPYYGTAEPLNIKRALQSSLTYMAYLAKMCQMNVSTIAHTVWPVFLLLTAYGVYYLLSKRFIQKTEDRFLFLFLVAILYTYGYYSHYSTSFRLLGVIWQGKAILAVVLNPFLLYVFLNILRKEYDRKSGFMLSGISISAVALSMGGVISVAAFSCILTLLSLVRNRNWKNMLYLLWANVPTVVYATFYLITR